MTRFWRFAKQEVSRRTLFKGAAAILASGVAARLLVDQFSTPDEGAAESLAPAGPDFIDVRR